MSYDAAGQVLDDGSVTASASRPPTARSPRSSTPSSAARSRTRSRSWDPASTTAWGSPRRPRLRAAGRLPARHGHRNPGYEVVGKPPRDYRYKLGDFAMAKTGHDAAGASGSQFFVISGRSGEQLPPEYGILGHAGDEDRWRRSDDRRARPWRRPAERARHDHLGAPRGGGVNRAAAALAATGLVLAAAGCGGSSGDDTTTAAATTTASAGPARARPPRRAAARPPSRLTPGSPRPASRTRPGAEAGQKATS